MSEQSQVLDVVGAVIYRPSREVLIVRRSPGETGAGFWEFPGGKVESEEGPAEALQREIVEELGVPIRVGRLLGDRIHAYPQKTIRLRLYWAQAASENFILSEHDALEWIQPRKIDASRLSEADRPFLEEMIVLLEGSLEALA